MMQIRDVAGVTVRGEGHPVNEDAILVRVDDGLFAIADGMGGPGSGDTAALIAVGRLSGEIPPLAQGVGGPATSAVRLATSHALEAAFEVAHRAVEASADQLGRRAMGAALAALVVRGGTATYAHVGDARVWLWRHGVLQALTEDHTVAALRLRQGRMTPEEYLHSPLRNRLVQVIGSGEELDVGLAELELADGDLLLLTSDGVHEALRDEDIARELASSEDLDLVANQLVNLAMAAGGQDDASVILARISGDRAPVDAAEVARIVRTNYLFRELSEADVRVVAPYLERRVAEPGEVICREGDPADGLWLVVRGRVAITAGHLHILDVDPGQTFGELGLTRATTRSATVVAREPTELYGLSRGRFDEILRRRPTIGTAMLHALLDRVADRLRATTDRLAAAEDAASTSGVGELRDAVLAALAPKR